MLRLLLNLNQLKRCQIRWPGKLSLSNRKTKSNLWSIWPSVFCCGLRWNLYEFVSYAISCTRKIARIYFTYWCRGCIRHWKTYWQKPQIKWVNDLYLNNKKFVGILAETSLNPAKGTQVVIGVGINFSISQFPPEIENKATSLFYNEKPNINRSELIAEIWSEFHRLSTGSFWNL